MTIVLAILALGLLIIVHEGGHYLVAKWSGMRVDRFSIGFGPQIASFKRGETQFQIALIPLGGFVQIAGLNPGDDTIADDDPRNYMNRPVWQRLATIFAGPATNYIFAIVVMSLLFLVAGVPAAPTKPTIDEPVAAGTAKFAGLRSGDEITAINDKPIVGISEVAPAVNASGGLPIKFDVKRAGVLMTFMVQPFREKEGEAWRIGVALGADEWKTASFGECIRQGVTFPILYSAFVLESLPKLFSGRSPEKVSGPLGIVGQMKTQIEKGWKAGVRTVTIISIALGLFNLLPLPALDGGRIVFLLWEAVSRRRFNQKAEATIHMLGLAVLLSFMLFVTFKNDIPHLWAK